MRVLQEHLSLEVADAIMFNAMRMADAPAIPEDPAGLLLFVLGSLDIAIERRAGRNTADDVLAHLEPLLTDARERVKASSTASGVAPKSTPSFPVVGSDEMTDSGVHPRIEEQAPSSRIPTSRIPASTILVASADTRERNTLRRDLQHRGHRVVAAHDGHVGLALCVRYQPALVICDYDMPRVSGKEMVSSLKLALGSSLPRIILLTPSPMEPVADVFIQLPKPVSPDVLDDLVAAVLTGD